MSSSTLCLHNDIRNRIPRLCASSPSVPARAYIHTTVKTRRRGSIAFRRPVAQQEMQTLYESGQKPQKARDFLSGGGRFRVTFTASRGYINASARACLHPRCGWHIRFTCALDFQ